MKLKEKSNPLRDDVSACIVTYNNDSDMVIAAVESFLQTRLKVNMTIADNNSSSDTFGLLENEFRKKKNIQVIATGRNGGYGFGHNFGLKNSLPARYHLVMNPDVVIHKGSLEKMVHYMDTHPDVAMVAPRVLNPDGTMQYLNKRNPAVMDLFIRRFLPASLQEIFAVKNRLKHYMMLDTGYDSITEVPFLSGSFMLIRKDLLRTEPLFDDRFFMYFEDADLTRRIGKYGKVIYFPEAVITHHWARFAHTKIKFMLIFMQSAIRYFNKWGWKLV